MPAISSAIPVSVSGVDGGASDDGAGGISCCTLVASKMSTSKQKSTGAYADSDPAALTDAIASIASFEPPAESSSWWW